jgi:hypothetical protein
LIFGRRLAIVLGVKGLLKIWLVLAITYVVGSLAITYIVSGGILYRWETTAHLILVPIFQAALLGAIAAVAASGGFRSLWAGLRSSPAVAILLALDVILIISIWLYEEWKWLEHRLPENYLIYFLIPQLAIVAVATVWRGVSEPRRLTKYLVIVLGCLMLGSAWDLVLGSFRPWRLALEGLLITLTAAWIYRRWREETPRAAALVAASVALFLPVNLILVSAALGSYDFSDLWLCNIVFTLVLPALTLIWFAAGRRARSVVGTGA